MIQLMDMISLMLNNSLDSTFDDESFMKYFQDPENNNELYTFVAEFAFNTTLSNFNFHHVILGNKIGFQKIKLIPDQIYNLDLSNIINGGRLLYINYTPESGNLFPIEIHGNSPIGCEFSLTKILYPIKIPSNTSSPSIKTTVNVHYIYAPKEILNDIALKELTEAFQHYFKSEYIDTILKLQISSEFILTKFIHKYEPKLVDASYFLKLTVHLSHIIVKHKLIPCPHFILNNLNNMRIKRNKITHEGGTTEISNEEIKTWSISAFLFYKYFNIVHNI